MLCAGPVSAQLLYRIEGNGLSSPSFLMGTHHLVPVSFLDSIPGFRGAFDQAKQVCGEVIMDEMTDMESLQKLQNAMMMPEGMTLQQLLTPEEMASLNLLMKDLLGADLSNPFVAGQMGRMTPSALSTLLSVQMYVKHNPGFVANDGIDKAVQVMAREKGKNILSLETMDDQISTLLKGQPLERQKELLMCMVEHRDFEEQLMRDLVDAYYAQDLKRLEQVTDQQMEGRCATTDEEEEVILYGRNARWMEALPGIMRSGATLFVVGAGHLIGERGLIQLLREKGYRVEGVK